MQPTSADDRALADIAVRHGFSVDAAREMVAGLQRGWGSMAQFNHPEFGGYGQWMRGGMTMVGDMFNASLRNRVDALALDLSAYLASGGGQAARPAATSQPNPSQPNPSQPNPSQAHPSQSQAQTQGAGAFASAASFGGGFASAGAWSGNWWPDELHGPTSTGSQNQMRYAYFGSLRRLAIDDGSTVTVYDTLDHQIGGFSQQQSGSRSMSMSSQHGPVDLASLPVVSTEPSRR
jgi:hypothetical protein